MTPTSLLDWLSYIESQHPSEIELGLERGLQVLSKLGLKRPKHKVITVAGTNGKGSTCAMLTQYLVSQGHSVGTYTSPHFIDFNERIALNNSPCEDALICQAFELIEQVRGDIPLTYFEFSTLAALWVFDQSELDYWVLEVGLGGRLDSVNMIDADVAVVTSIALDHVDWLGDDINVIACEKAGIARQGKLLVSGVVNPPKGIADTAVDIGADLKQKGVDFQFSANQKTWSWENEAHQFDDLPIPSLPLENAATVVAVLIYMGLELQVSDLIELFATVELTGRFQQVSQQPDVYIDVAHNPEAAVELQHRLAVFETQPIAVCGMLHDKDIGSVVKTLANSFVTWHCSDLAGPRGATAQELVAYLDPLDAISQCYSDIASAFVSAIEQAQQEGRPVVVFGSFVTVSDYLEFAKGKNDL
ncbi:bifunctional tetrahydrofolate synthase/dihydrofolate synthase [Marinomonas posidonica]|uniref:Dihydrofolate synthase/folylpolyglutamate synthase n=1 Tax=Marinomonas posidonica (strain CECT 7376 / NCIMB 14433 / IVIA-Po-181) TaxID=491952 RepID=F6CZA9_MARPP|nr:bifunctional tetrahydrofolate synthase/dihydrofolate synthase [Marinomonas posidonica]AEF54646.1 FolC bifunctional protein [Marinomonas posidonica IVIA-Po-181]